MADLEKDFDYRDEHFDFIQQRIRNFCLKCESSRNGPLNPWSILPYLISNFVSCFANRDAYGL